MDKPCVIIEKSQMPQVSCVSYLYRVSAVPSTRRDNFKFHFVTGKHHAVPFKRISTLKIPPFGGHGPRSVIWPLRIPNRRISDRPATVWPTLLKPRILEQPAISISYYTRNGSTVARTLAKMTRWKIIKKKKNTDRASVSTLLVLNLFLDSRDPYPPESTTMFP